MALSRASRGSVEVVDTTPAATTVTAPGPASRIPKPVSTSPGSTPITRTPLGRRDGVEDLVGDVVVGIDGLDVVLLLERLDQAQHGGGVLAFHPHRGLGDHGGLCLEHRHSLGLERLAHRLHFIRGSGDLENFFHRSHVGGPGLQRLLEHLVLFRLLAVHLDDPAPFEHPGHAVRRAHAPALLLEDVPDLGPGAVLVVRQHAHEHGHPARPIALIGDLLVLLARYLARALLDGPLDVVRWHVGRLGGLHGRLETEIALRVAAAVLRGHRDLAEDLGEELPALHVGLALLALDLGPPGVSRHDVTFLPEWMLSTASPARVCAHTAPLPPPSAASRPTSRA